MSGLTSMRSHHVEFADDELTAVSLGGAAERHRFEVGGNPYDRHRTAAYRVVIDGETDYGGVRHADLTGGVLTLEFREPAAKSVVLLLDFEPDVVASLGRALRTVFTSGSFEFRPVLAGDLAIEPGGTKEVFLYFEETPDTDFALDELEEIVEGVLGDAGEVTGSGLGQTGGNLDIGIWGEVDFPAVLRTLAVEFMDIGVPGEAEFHLIGENRRLTLESLAGSTRG